MGLDPDRPAGQAAEKLIPRLQNASPLEPRTKALDVGLEPANNHVIRAEYRDSRGEKNEPGHNRQQAADHAQD